MDGPLPKTYYQNVVGRAVQEMLDAAEEARCYVIDVLWPSLTEPMPPANRLAAYHMIDWNRLRILAPQLYTKLSGDALKLNITTQPAPPEAAGLVKPLHLDVKPTNQGPNARALNNRITQGILQMVGSVTDPITGVQIPAEQWTRLQHMRSQQGL